MWDKQFMLLPHTGAGGHGQKLIDIMRKSNYIRKNVSSHQCGYWGQRMKKVNINYKIMSWESSNLGIRII